MNILITGGAGFIGAFTAKALAEQGDTVVLYDDLNDFLYSPALKQDRLNALFPDKETRPRLIVGSILDGKLLNNVIAEENIDTILHFAALANPARSLNAAHEYTQVNVHGTLNVLEAATANDITRFIMAGSSSVYSDKQTPFQEDQYPLRPVSPYGASKAAAETYCRMWHDLHGLPITILRFFSVYGPWGRPDMAPMIFAQHILKDEPIAITANRQRDFTYIDDIVSGIVAAAGKQFAWEVINLGRGEPVALDDLVDALARAAGKEVTRTDRPAPAGELAITYADTSKAKELLGYVPKVSVGEGAQHLIEWLKEYQK